MFKKIILVILLLLAVSVLLPARAYAQDANQQATDTPTSTFANYPIQQLWQRYCDDRKGNVINLQTWYSGKCTGDPSDPASIGFSDIVLLDFYTLLQGEPGQTLGALPILGNGIVALYGNPPASSIDYFAYVKQNLAEHNLVQQAYAQTPGYGFQALSPVIPLWRAFRNVVYALFILVFVFYGFFKNLVVDKF